MQNSRIDYYYTAKTLAAAIVMAFFVIVLFAFVIWLGEITSWKIAAIPAILASIAGYGSIKDISRSIHSKEPALSLLPECLVVGTGRDSKQIAYEHIYSLEVEAGRGFCNIALRYFDLGRMAVVSIDAAGLGTSPETIVEAVAQRIPPQNNPKSGSGMLICAPAEARLRPMGEMPS